MAAVRYRTQAPRPSLEGDSPKPPANRGSASSCLILEMRGDKAFSEPCPVESGSDNPFPYHHFIMSNHHKPTGTSVVIRFCARCGLSHLLDWTTMASALGEQVQYTTTINLQCWQPIKENERDMTVSEPCLVEQRSDASKQRYMPISKS